MEQEVINGDLLIHGNLNCGKDGVLEADGAVTWQFKDALDNAYKEMFANIPEGDFELEGRNIIVHGSVKVWGMINYDIKTWTGRVVAGRAY